MVSTPLETKKYRVLSIPEKIEQLVNNSGLSADLILILSNMQLDANQLRRLEEIIQEEKAMEAYPNPNIKLLYISPAVCAITTIGLAIATAKTDLSPDYAIAFACLTLIYMVGACYLDMDDRRRIQQWPESLPKRVQDTVNEWIKSEQQNLTQTHSLSRGVQTNYG